MLSTIAWHSQSVVLSPVGYEAPVTGNPVSAEKVTKPQVHVGPKWYGAAWRGSVQNRLPRHIVTGLLSFLHALIIESVSHQSECTQRQSPAKC